MRPDFGCNLDDLLFESLDTTLKTLMADRITTYMAQEIVRRERMEAALLETAPRKTAVSAPQSSGPGTGVVLAAFIIGVITGAAGLFAAVWLSVP